MRFFVGTHQLHHAQHLGDVFISVNRLRDRRSDFVVGDWIMDSGAFTEVTKHGHYRSSVREYALAIRRWKHNGNLLAAVAQDFMCEQWVLDRTALQIRDHQSATLARYDELVSCRPGAHIIPVLQGYAPADYVQHLAMYGEQLTPGMWVGVGSVCKRNATPQAVLDVLRAIKTARPDLQLHGFGVKTTSLLVPEIRELLATADSMAWSLAARFEGRDQNDWREALAFADRIKEAA